jgi:signal transduction histidine kinase/BarA-like signal transduction histidine kinase
MAGPDSNMLAYIAALHASDWRLVALIPEEIIGRPARNIVRASAGVMLISLLIVSIGATFFLRRIIRPLREIIDRFRLLRTAPDAKQTDMIVIGNDEIAHLGDGFNDLLGALRARQQSEEELRVLNRDLEVRVEARTRDLEITNADLSLARDAAEVASRAKSAFLANMSHELRTPMNAIMGFTDLARKRGTDPKQQDQLTHVTRASQHLLDVINDILDISRIEANRVKLTQHVFTPGVVVEDALNLTAQEAANKGLRLSTSLSPELARTSLLGDPTRLRQILVNLINNAIKFTKHGAINVRIGVTAETPSDVLLRCEIQDTGIGISAEDLKRLFTAFEQADNSMTRRYGGAGLGLAISKRLVHMMRGEIGVESQLGLGSTFWFTVRLGRVASETPMPAGANGSAAYEIKFRHAGARILLAEDDPANQEVTIELLTDIDLKVDLAENGVQAVDMAAHIHYDLILMDIRMPELNGVDAARAIRNSALNAKTPILALTANAYDEDREACTAAGMNDHIAKPVSPDRLFAILLKWLP